MPTRLSALDINVSLAGQPCTRRSRARYLPANRLSVAKGTFLQFLATRTVSCDRADARESSRHMMLAQAMKNTAAAAAWRSVPMRDSASAMCGVMPVRRSCAGVTRSRRARVLADASTIWI